MGGDHTAHTLACVGLIFGTATLWTWSRHRGHLRPNERTWLLIGITFIVMAVFLVS